jgi:phosphoglycerate dehydrogenase-like enzyme
VDLDAARRLGVSVSSTGGANARSVAELAIALLLALARSVPHHDRSVRTGTWARRTGIELAGKRLGIVGYGAVGREVSRIAQALGMHVVAHDPFVAEADVSLLDLDELLATSDAVSLHVPLDNTTRGLIDAAALGKMRPGALLVNTARGDIIDEAALADSLTSGALGGAALDTFSREPPAGSPLLALETFIASPHAGSATTEAIRRMAVEAVDLLLKAV